MIRTLAATRQRGSALHDGHLDRRDETRECALQRDPGPQKPVALRDPRLLRALELEIERQHPGADGMLLAIGVDDLGALDASDDSPNSVMDAVPQLLRESAPEPGLVGHVGHDVVALLLPDADDYAAAQKADEILAAFRALTSPGSDDKLRAVASAGMTRIRGFDRTPLRVLNEAELALGRAKDAGRDRWARYSPEIARGASSRSDSAAGIRRALDRGDLSLLAQPVHRVGEPEPEQHELLVRLRPAEGELIPPATFFPTAERYGMLERIDRWVLARAFELVQAAPDGPAYEVNTSVHSMSDPGYIALARERLAQGRIDPASLIFDLNEPGQTYDRAAVMHFASELRTLGCRFALDNFGFEHGALIALRELPLDFVKIDGRFIRHLTCNKNDQAMVRAISQLCRELGIQSIATFVADEETVDLLGKLGVDLVQGFHVGMPTPVAVPS